MATAAERTELLRVAWERDLERQALSESTGPRRPPVDPGKADERVPLDKLMASRIHAVAERAAARLGFVEPYALYLTPRSERRLSAQALIDDTPFAVRLIGPVASALDDDALAALIGHEMGHKLAHGGSAEPESTVLQAWGRGASVEVARLSTLAAELTADRFALIAGESLEAVVRLEVGIETLESPAALGVRELDLLAERCRQIEEPGARAVRPDGYPLSPYRLLASSLFWDTREHHELTGRGSGELSLRDVDARLLRIARRDIGGDAAPVPSPSRAALRPASKESASKEATAPPRTARGTANPPPPAKGASPSLAGRIETSLWSAVAAVKRAVADKPAPPPRRPPEGTASLGGVSELEDVDDFEARFRALEQADRRTEAVGAVPDDVEARFRALEEAERRGRE